jgi:threonine/homoserine/homoserine lactone efflux protein
MCSPVPVLVAALIGLIFGFVAAMPIAGPVAAVVVSQTLDGRPRTALLVAFGSAIAETAYVFMAFWGMATLLRRFPLLLPASRIVACLVIAALGLYFVIRPTGRSKGKPQKDRKSAAGRLGNLALGLTMTGANPTLIVTWTAAVGILRSANVIQVDARNALPFAGGVGLGIVAWSFTLVWLLGIFRDRVGEKMLGRVIRGMGFALIVGSIGLGIRMIAQH